MTSRHGQYNIETPTYYVVLQDTLNDWSREKMINLTYKLTHAYYNKAVCIYFYLLQLNIIIQTFVKYKLIFGFSAPGRSRACVKWREN